MAWKKLGMVFDLGRHSIGWLKSHAMLPTPLLLGDRLRIYFTGRDFNGHSRISFVEVSSRDPSHICYVHDRPLLDIGRLGTFDDSGTLGSCAVRNGNEVFLYYNGYNRRVTVPWSNAIGLAVSRDDGITFERVFEGPILDRTCHEPLFVVSGAVLREPDIWHMWYTSGTRWVLIKGVPEPLYVIKYARSTDGISWQRPNITCIEPLDVNEANARAAVVKDGTSFRMWFCYRGSMDFRNGSDSYRIGYAEAIDPCVWTRRDEDAALTGGPEAWDSMMQAYPAVVTINGQRYLFYNGNGFGVAGFGCAVWE